MKNDTIFHYKRVFIVLDVSPLKICLSDSYLETLLQLFSANITNILELSNNFILLYFYYIHENHVKYCTYKYISFIYIYIYKFYIYEGRSESFENKELNKVRSLLKFLLQTNNILGFNKIALRKSLK